MSIIMWCIHCEKEVNVRFDPLGEIKVYHDKSTYFNDGWTVCQGPFTSSPPPVMTEDEWDDVLSRDEYPEEQEEIFPPYMSDGLGI